MELLVDLMRLSAFLPPRASPPRALSPVDEDLLAPDAVDVMRENRHDEHDDEPDEEEHVGRVPP